jgi:acetyltransferase, GNAT family
MAFIIETMVRLRALDNNDLDLLCTLENDPALWPCSATSAPYSRYALQEFIIRAATADIFALRQLRLVVEVVTPTPEAVGLVDIFDFDPAHRRAEVGIALLPEHRQKGYAHDALLDLCRFAHDMLSLHQLYAYVPEDNVPSHRLFAGCDFTHTATLPDWFLYANAYKSALLWQKRL